MFGLLLLLASSQELAPAKEIIVRTAAELRVALTNLQPGVTIAIAPGTYEGGFFVSERQGLPSRPLRIVGLDSKNPPVVRGGQTGLHLSKVRHLEIRNLRIEGCAQNGINIDDGGDRRRASEHIVLADIQVRDLPRGNHDGIKLSGVDRFRVERCRLERWGGSGVDMVGCHIGQIVDCDFVDGGDSAVQAKGGSKDVRIERSRFVDFGQRGVNAGGSTGLPYFRPPVEAMPSGGRYEASQIAVQGCTFLRGGAPIAFVGVDGARFEFNTIVEPGRWAMRILQETQDAAFVPSRRGIVSRNLIVFRSDHWSEGGVNIGPGTDPGSFRFEHNFWFCSDQPTASRPKLPTAESNGVYGVDPLMQLAGTSEVSFAAGSPAKAYGAGAFKPPSARR